MKRKIVISYGTRPELIKLAPLILALKNHIKVDLIVVNTGQHIEMVKELEELFKIKPDFELKIMKPNQSLNHILSSVIEEMDKLLEKIKPDLVFIQGDTTTVLATSLACFNRNVSVGHIEAGLRSFDFTQPFPEEFNRRLVSVSAKYNFAPTKRAAKNLEEENIAKDKIFITGNTVIDTIYLLMDKLGLKNEMPFLKKILITAHRRENHGEGIRNICEAVKKIVKNDENIHFLWPVHPNPNVKDVVYKELSGLERVELVEPLSYFDLLKEMSKSFIIWTDSGGIQEEAPTFKKPVLILRNITERPEVIDEGFGKLVGTDMDIIGLETLKLLNDKSYYQKMISGKNPFGDGKAVEHILKAINV